MQKKKLVTPKLFIGNVDLEWMLSTFLSQKLCWWADCCHVRHAVCQKHLEPSVNQSLPFEFLYPILCFMISAFHSCLRGSSPFSLAFSESKWRNLCLYKCRDETQISTQLSWLNKQIAPPCCGACCREAARTWKAVRHIGSLTAKTHKYRWRPRQGKHFDS